MKVFFFLPVGLEWQEFKGVLVKNLSFGRFWRSVLTEGVFIIMDLTYKKNQVSYLSHY